MKLNFKQIANDVRIAVAKNSPDILTGLGVAAFITGTVGAIYGTTKAVKRVEKVKKEKGVEKLTKKEIVKETYKYYIVPTMCVVGGTILTYSGSSKLHKRNAALATAYGLSERALIDYKEEVKKVLGPKKLEEVEENATIAKAKIIPVPEETAIINTGHGQTLCLDAVSGRYFRSDINHIKTVINDLNFRMRSEMYMSLNDLYYELDLPIIAIGGELGWHIDDGGIDPVFGSTLTDNGTPCLVLDYCVEPKYDYRTTYC